MGVIGIGLAASTVLLAAAPQTHPAIGQKASAVSTTAGFGPDPAKGQDAFCVV